MALINCPECNKEISDTAKNCIHCGYVLKEENNVIQPQTVIIEPKKGLSAKKNLNIGAIIFMALSIVLMLSYLVVKTENYESLSDLIWLFDKTLIFTIFSAIQSIVILFVPKIRKKWFLVLYLIINLFLLPQCLVLEAATLSLMMLLVGVVTYVLGYIFVIKSMVNKD